MGGKRSGLFFEIVRLTSELRPRFVFLENVSAITVRGAERVVGELCGLGYDCRWGLLSASDVGANHRRERWWLLAHARYGGGGDVGPAQGRQDAPKERSGDHDAAGGPSEQPAAMADPASGESRIPTEQEGWQDPGGGSQEVNVADPECDGREKQRDGGVPRRKTNPTTDAGWWESEPNVGRVVDGFSAWLDRLDLDPCLRVLSMYVNSNQISASKALRMVRETYGTPAFFQWPVRGPHDVCSPSVLLPFMRRLETAAEKKQLSQTSPKVQRRPLRGLPDKKEVDRPPHRPKLPPQLAKQHPDSLQKLSRFLAQYCAKAWAKDRGSYAPNRIEQLRGLGNAVVPAQAREAFERLMGLK